MVYMIMNIIKSVIYLTICPIQCHLVFMHACMHASNACIHTQRWIDDKQNIKYIRYATINLTNWDWTDCALLKSFSIIQSQCMNWFRFYRREFSKLNKGKIKLLHLLWKTQQFNNFNFENRCWPLFKVDQATFISFQPRVRDSNALKVNVICHIISFQIACTIKVDPPFEETILNQSVSVYWNIEIQR